MSQEIGFSPKLREALEQIYNRISALEGVVNPDGDVMFTADGGTAYKMINKTGANSVKGTVLSAGTSVDNSVMLQNNEFDTIGIMYSDGVADGQYVWVVKSGKAKVLLKDGTGSSCGNWVCAADTDGRANSSLTQPPGNNTLQEVASHLKEIGHCLETKTAGTNVLALCSIHCN